MRATLVLAAHSLRRARTMVLVMALLLALFEVLLVLGAQSLQEAGTFKGLAALVPPFIRQVVGDSLLVLMSFSGIVAFGFFHPMVIAATVGLVLTVATEPPGDLETGFLDLVMARPLPRRAVVARSALLLVLLPAVVIACMAAASLLALRVLGPPGDAAPDPSLVAGLALNLWALVVCAGGLTLAVAAAARRRSVAIGTASVVLLAAFFVDYLARIWKPASHLTWLSPFHYYDAMKMVMGSPVPFRHVAVLLAAGMIGVAVAFAVFERRDL